MKYLLIAALCATLGGFGMIGYALTLPVYTDPDAPGRLSVALEKLPEKQKFGEWYKQLAKYETPHKRLSDWGQSVAAVGLGLSMACGVIVLYRRHAFLRTVFGLLTVWLLSWGIQVLGIVWFYWYREQRFDYPAWGDAIAIPISEEALVAAACCVTTTVLLLFLNRKFALPDRLTYRKPQTGLEWARAIVIAVWLAVLVFGIVASVPHGDVGTIVSSLIAGAVLLLILGAKRTAPTPR